MTWDPSKKMRHEIPYPTMYFSSQTELSCSSYDTLKVYYNHIIMYIYI